MSNSGRATRKRGATEVDSTTTSTFRPGQVVAVEAAAFGNFEKVSQGTAQKADEFGRVVSRAGVRKGGTNSSLIPTSLDVLQVVDFPDGSSYTINRKFLSLVVEEDAATDTTSEHRQVGKLAKTRAPSKEKEDAAEEESEEQSQEESDERSGSDYDEEGEAGEEGREEAHRHAKERAKARARGSKQGKKRAAHAGANTSKPAKKKKTSAPACQVRSDKNTTGVKVTRTDGQHTALFTKINVVTNDSRRWHRQGKRFRSIRG